MNSLKPDARDRAFSNLSQNLAQSLGTKTFDERSKKAAEMHAAEKERIAKAEAKRARRAERNGITE